MNTCSSIPIYFPTQLTYYSQLLMGNMRLPCVLLVRSHFKVRVLWLPPIICVAVYMMIRCGYIFPRFCFLFECANISLWLHLVLETSYFFQNDAWSLLSVRHSFMWSDVISEFSSIFVPVLLLFGVPYWLWCLIAACLPFTISPIAFKVL